jgi:hypothetical protein
VTSKPLNSLENLKDYKLLLGVLPPYYYDFKGDKPAKKRLVFAKTAQNHVVCV